MNTLDKYKIHISVRGSLLFMPLSPCTDKEWKILPHVILTSDKDWDPTRLYCKGQLENE